MPTVGEQLRQAREAQHLAIHQVADFTKIRGDHIRALEEGNYSVFSAPVYIRGFVRTYANLLKLDPRQLLDQLSHELSDSGQREPTLSPPSHGVVDAAMFQLSKVGMKLILPAIGIALVAGAIVVSYLVWARSQHQDPLEGLGPGLYQGPVPGDTLPLPAAR